MAMLATCECAITRLYVEVGLHCGRYRLTISIESVNCGVPGPGTFQSPIPWASSDRPSAVTLFFPNAVP